MSREEYRKKQREERVSEVFGDPEGRDCEECVKFMDCNASTGCLGFEAGKDYDD